MSTIKPRITVTLEKDHHRLLALVASQQRRSVSALIGELVAVVAPSYERLSVILAEASRANGEVLDGLRSGVERAEDTISDLLRPSTAQYDLFARARGKASRNAIRAEERLRVNKRLESGAFAAVAARNERARPGASDPRPVNTGVRSASRTAKTRSRAGRRRVSK